MKIKVKIPQQCPSCSTNLTRVKDQIFCKNSSCEAVSHKRVVSYAKVLKIKGLGEKSIEKLGLDNIPDIYKLTEASIFSAIGEKNGTKVLLEIEKSKNTSLATLLAAFSIPLIGNTAGNKVAQHTSSIYDINKEVCKLAGLGEKATTNLLTWLIDNKSMYDDIPVQTNVKPVVSSSGGQVVCISGKLTSFPNKAKATDFLNSLGYVIVSGMSKKVNYLISEDNKESSKIKLARQYNTEVLTIDELKRKTN